MQEGDLWLSCEKRYRLWVVDALDEENSEDEVQVTGPAFCAFMA